MLLRLLTFRSPLPKATPTGVVEGRRDTYLIHTQFPTPACRRREALICQSVDHFSRLSYHIYTISVHPNLFLGLFHVLFLFFFFPSPVFYFLDIIRKVGDRAMGFWDGMRFAWAGNTFGRNYLPIHHFWLGD